MAESLIYNRDFILFGLQPWDIEIGSNFKNMAMELARNNRVLYVNYPADRISLLRNKGQQRIKNRMAAIKQGKNVLAEQMANLWVLNPQTIVESVNWIPFPVIYDRMNLINNKRIAGEINKAIANLKFSDPVLLIDNDFLRGFYLPELVSNDLFLFYIRDYLLSQPYFKRHGARLEKEMIKKSDATICNSAFLTSYAGQYNEHSYDIGQGCDIDDFLITDAAMPDELKGIDGPLIGYCGSLLASRLDIGLIEAIATNNPQCNFILVGPEDETFKGSSLHRLKNIYFLGPKPFSVIPSFVHHFDICINPQLVNEMTLGNYPRKIDEYLAAGKPVLVTETPAMEIFKDYVYVCKTADDYGNNIRKALNEATNVDLKNKRIAFARSHTWKSSIEKLYKVIQLLIKDKELTFIKKEVAYDQ